MWEDYKWQGRPASHPQASASLLSGSAGGSDRCTIWLLSHSWQTGLLRERGYYFKFLFPGMWLLITELVWGLVLFFNNMLTYSESPPSGCFCPSWHVSWQPFDGFSLRLNWCNSLQDMEQHHRYHSWWSSGHTAGHSDVPHGSMQPVPCHQLWLIVEAEGESLGSSVCVLIPTIPTAGGTLSRIYVYLAVPKINTDGGGTVGWAPGSGDAAGELWGWPSSMAGTHRAQGWRFHFHLRLKWIYLDLA